ncbi:MAG: hypothetical protein ACFBQW_05295 [Sphingomonadaceae bacterium]
MAWLEFKDWLSDLSGLSKDALHIYAALLVQLAAAALLRRSLASPLPWLAVLVFLLANEAVDLWFDPLEDEVKPWKVQGLVVDLANTLLAPTLLLVIARRAPRLLTPPAGSGRGGSSR